MQFFSTLIYCVEKTKADVAICKLKRTSVCDEDREYDLDSLLLSVYDNKEGLDHHTIKSYSCGRIYKTEALVNHRFDEGVKISEDTLFNLGVIADNQNIKTVLIDAELYYYYDRADSAINTSQGLDFKVLSYIYLDRAEQADDKYVAGIYLNDAFKNTFTVRYLTRMTAEKQLKGEICELLKRCLQIEKTKKPLPFKKAFVYELMSHFPIIYTLFRRVKER